MCFKSYLREMKYQNLKSKITNENAKLSTALFLDSFLNFDLSFSILIFDFYIINY